MHPNCYISTIRVVPSLRSLTLCYLVSLIKVGLFRVVSWGFWKWMNTVDSFILEKMFYRSSVIRWQFYRQPITWITSRMQRGGSYKKALLCGMTYRIWLSYKHFLLVGWLDDLFIYHQFMKLGMPLLLNAMYEKILVFC